MLQLPSSASSQPEAATTALACIHLMGPRKPVPARLFLACWFLLSRVLQNATVHGVQVDICKVVPGPVSVMLRCMISKHATSNHHTGMLEANYHEKQDSPYTYLARHELESVNAVVLILRCYYCGVITAVCRLQPHYQQSSVQSRVHSNRQHPHRGQP